MTSRGNNSLKRAAARSLSYLLPMHFLQNHFPHICGLLKVYLVSRDYNNFSIEAQEHIIHIVTHPVEVGACLWQQTLPNLIIIPATESDTVSILKTSTAAGFDR